MKYEFGRASTERLNTCHPDLQRVAQRALSYGVLDFSITEGHRSLERQQQLYREHKSRIDGVTSKGNHNYEPSRAFDFVPYPGRVNGVNVWDDKQRFAVIAGLLYAAAAELGVKIRWGGDWDGDGNNADSRLHDMPHIEISA